MSAWTHRKSRTQVRDDRNVKANQRYQDVLRGAPSKADLRDMLAEAARNTAEQQKT